MQTVKSVLSQLDVGVAVFHRNLATYPLISRESVASSPGYLLLDEAIANGWLKITEVSEVGSVPELRVRNSGDRPVLLLDGEELIGAKQNRILNLSVLVPASAETIIPVSCVEAGRWAYRTPEFMASPRAQYASGRARKTEQVSIAMLATGARHADQGAVWDDIADKGERMHARSPTGAMADIFDRHAESLDDFITALPPAPRQVGAIFTVNGVVAGLDLFDHPDTWARLMPKLVRSFAVEAIDSSDPRSEYALPEDVTAFLAGIGEAPASVFPSVGLGEDVRIASDGMTAAGLLHDDQLLHLCAFPRGGTTHQTRRWARPVRLFE